MLDDAEATIAQVTISNGIALNAGVIYGLKSTIIMISTECNNNKVTGKAGAIILLNGILQMEKVTMANNEAEQGTLVSTAESNIYVIDSDFTDNYGGAISSGF